MWKPIETAPENKEIWTKVEDRNEQRMTKKGNLWWTSDGMYVYYTPTHWKL